MIATAKASAKALTQYFSNQATEDECAPLVHKGAPGHQRTIAVRICWAQNRGLAEDCLAAEHQIAHGLGHALGAFRLSSGYFGLEQDWYAVVSS